MFNAVQTTYKTTISSEKRLLLRQKELCSRLQYENPNFQRVNADVFPNQMQVHQPLGAGGECKITVPSLRAKSYKTPFTRQHNYLANVLYLPMRKYLHSLSRPLRDCFPEVITWKLRQNTMINQHLLKARENAGVMLFCISLQ